MRARVRSLVEKKPFVDLDAWQARAERSGKRAYRGEGLSFEHRGVALEVTMKRAPCNEIGTVMLRDLEEVARYLAEGAGGARAVIFTSDLASGFSAGADLRELYTNIVDRRARGISLVSRARELRDFIERIHRAFDVIDTVPITTIAAVHGVCFGGGLELALTCDIIVADKSARFCFPELRLGLVPGFGGVPRLRRDVGNAVVRDLLLTGRSLGASRAHEVGLVSQLVARDKAHEVARQIAEQAARFDRGTATRAKPFVKPIPSRELDHEKDVFTHLFVSPAVEESLAKFVRSTDVRPYLP
jgi:enoyl-CoA hydratase/carnithine racemase